MTIELEPVGHVRGGRAEAVDDDWGAVEAVIELAPAIHEEALLGLEAFSHALIVFHFDRVDPAMVATTLRRPRGNPSWPALGVFAQRGSPRPNRLGVTAAEVVRVDGRRLHVRGLDAIDGTPVLDIKPVIRGFEPRSEIRQPAWADEIMAAYW